ncbi:hypothetical protein AVEN_10587-1 [Araneus ventricosus]|uniref:Uncharacterized protein n=1 Tax=Araneus ventricosus TaxID=182803 RepID=A0A4Y2PZX3_ARAVE|nr:hypothetical protein AVEN_10587-1 [Araneus ventricosus]
MDNASRRYRKLKGRPSKRKRLWASNISKRWEKNEVENSAISVGAEGGLSNEGKEKKNSLNLSATKLEVLPSTSASTSNAIEKILISLRITVWGLPFSLTQNVMNAICVLWMLHLMALMALLQK